MNIDSDNSVKDEMFCLKYELNLFAGAVMGYGLERWIEGFTPLIIHNEHVQRYAFASRFTKGRKVLDIACGTGRGSRILAENGAASQVIGYDLEENAIRYAGIKNRHPNVTFNVRNGLQLEHRSEFDVVVCFETIEHVPTPEIFISRLAASLRQDGLLLISTPISAHEIDLKPRNPHHLREWGEIAFRRLVEKDFLVRKIHLQYRPIWRPTLFARILAKIRGVAISCPDQGRVAPNWDEFDADKATPALRSGCTGYQILECLRR